DGKSKKAKETELLKGLFDRLGVGNYQIDPRESPDFRAIFTGSERTLAIGCEVTTLHSDNGNRGSPQRKEWEEWKRFARELRIQLDQRGHEHLYGVLFFRKPLQSLPREQIIQERLKACDEFPVADRRDVLFPSSEYPALSSLLEFIRLFKFP